MRNELIQKRLFSEDSQTVEMALVMETADKNLGELHTPSNSGSSHEVLQYSGKARKKCYRCGQNHHEDCAFHAAACRKFGKQGHIAPVCKSGYSDTR